MRCCALLSTRLACPTSAGRLEGPTMNMKSRVEYDKCRYSEEREQILAACAEYRRKNPEKNRERARLYREQNRDALRQKAREKYHQYHARVVKWRKEHPDRVREYTRVSQAKRRAIEASARPRWLNDEQIREMSQKYREALALGLHVDHIIPLRGIDVCGLHVPWNLQLLSEFENKSKGNRP